MIRLTWSDLNAYLPSLTITWCEEYLHNHGYNLPITQEQTNDDGSHIHVEAYLELRQAVQKHLNHDVELMWSLLP